MIRAILIIVTAAVIGTAGGLVIYAVWPRPAASPDCQFLRWEYQQLWPDGGGPPLPAGC